MDGWSDEMKTAFEMLKLMSEMLAGLGKDYKFNKTPFAKSPPVQTDGGSDAGNQQTSTQTKADETNTVSGPAQPTAAADTSETTSSETEVPATTTGTGKDSDDSSDNSGTDASAQVAAFASAVTAFANAVAAFASAVGGTN